MEKLVIDFTWKKAPDKFIYSRTGEKWYMLSYTLNDGTVKRKIFQHILQLNIDTFDALPEDKFLKAVKEAYKTASMKNKNNGGYKGYSGWNQ